MEETKYCSNCEFSTRKVVGAFAELYCIHPEVICNHSSSLGGIPENQGVKCIRERSKVFFGKCGRKGKLWSYAGEKV